MLVRVRAGLNLLLLTLAFFIAVIGTVPDVRADSCGNACSDENDCPGDDCGFCQTGGGPQVCDDCCIIDDDAVCQTTPGCNWDSGTEKCQNNVGVTCAPQIPELPSGGARFLVLGILVSVLLAGSYLYRRNRPRPNE